MDQETLPLAENARRGGASSIIHLANNSTSDLTPRGSRQSIRTTGINSAAVCYPNFRLRSAICETFT